MSKKIELNLTLDQLKSIRHLIAYYDKNGNFNDVYNIINEKIAMNSEPEENNNFPEELNNYEEE